MAVSYTHLLIAGVVASGAARPAVSVGDERKVLGSEIKEGKTSPPKHFTEDLSLIHI